MPSEARDDIRAVLAGADLVCSEAQVGAALDRMAGEITARLADSNPVVLVVMTGAMVPATWLLQRLGFPLEIDYLHATRYQGTTIGRTLDWYAHPRTDLRGRCVLVVDDILDEGVTLEAIVSHCRAAGARSVLTAVLADKATGRPKALERADFCGLTVPDRYVFGCGMDYHGYLRNLPAIYALGEVAQEEGDA